MDMMTAVKTVLGKYVDFNGRAPRSEYWWWYLFVIIVSIVLGVIDGMVFGSGQSILGAIFSLGILLPFIAVSARRLHDIDRSGWWMLIALIPMALMTDLLLPIPASRLM